VLGQVITEELYTRFPRMREGELSRLRANLVNGQSLAQIARSIKLGPCIRLGSGEQRSGGRDRDSILADAMEAVTAGIYLDAGMEAVRACVLDLFAARLESLNPNLSHKDAKTRLQEVLQAQRKPLPIYSVIEVTGQAHQQEFVVQCDVALLRSPVTGTGRSRRVAEQEAAREALAFIELKGNGE